MSRLVCRGVLRVLLGYIIALFDYSGTLFGPPQAAHEKKKMKRGHLALRQEDCVPLHPLLKGYYLPATERRGDLLGFFW